MESKLALEQYEEDVLFAMFDSGLIGPKNYKSIEKVCSMIKWPQIAQKHKVKKKCSKVLRHLSSKGYIDFHGKAGDVASLTKFGVDYVMGKRKKEMPAQ